jgi:hypothetical protein
MFGNPNMLQRRWFGSPTTLWMLPQIVLTEFNR